METTKIYVLDKIKFLEVVKDLKKEALDSMDKTAEIRAEGKDTAYTPRDYEMVASAYANIILTISNTPSHQVEITI